MKTTTALLTLAGLLSLTSLHAQTSSTGAITAVDYTDSAFDANNVDTYQVDRTSSTNLTGDVEKTLNYRNRTRELNTFNVGSDVYTPLEITPDRVVIRRNPVIETGFENIVWTQTTGGFGNSSNTFDLEGPRFDSAEDALISNNMFVGMDNIFENNPSSTNHSDGQRLDIIFDGGITVNNALSFAVFERGGNDPFGIAAITSLDDGAGNPNGYSDIYFHPGTADSWGVEELYQAQTLVTRSEGDDSEPHFPSDIVVGGSNQQWISGVNISISEFGLANESQIFGYSLFAGDVNATSGAQLIDWLDTAVFPTNTNAENGGLDLMAYHGVYAIPEPGSLILAGILAATAFLGLMRRR